MAAPKPSLRVVHKTPVPAINPEMERAALGGLMIEPEYLPQVAVFLQARDFDEPKYQTLFGAMLALLEKNGNAPDVAQLDEYLRAHKLLAGVGGSGYTNALVSTCPNYTRTVEYCRTVFDLAIERQRRLIGESLAAGGITAEEAKRRLEALEARNNPTAPTGPHIMTARELMAATFAPPVWIVPDLIPQGFTVVSAKPKMGKTWFLLDLAIARAACGLFLGSYLDRGPVLYIAMEDTQESLQERLQLLLRDKPAPEGLDLVASDWPRLDIGGIAAIEAWLSTHPAGCVILDTLKRLSPPRRSNADSYGEDYALGASLKAAADKHGGAVIAVTHNRKASADDPLDEINASTGLMGAFDTGLVLRRTRGEADAVLYRTGRRGKEQELALRFDDAGCTWTLMGGAAEYAISKERRAIIEALRAGEASPKDLQSMLGKDVRMLLCKMVDDGQIASPRRGIYALKDAFTTFTSDTTDTSYTTAPLMPIVNDVNDVTIVNTVNDVNASYRETKERPGRPCARGCGAMLRPHPSGGYYPCDNPSCSSNQQLA